MEHEILWVTRLINAILGKPAGLLLFALGIQPANPAYPIPNHVAMELVVLVLAAVFFLWLKRRLSIDRPGAVQQCMEMYLSNPMGVGVRDLLEDIAGHGAGRYLAMIGTISLFVLLCNLISLIPGFESPTATASVPLGCAITVFLYYHTCGVRRHGGLGYGKQFLGPVLPLAIIMLPIEIISHTARLLSLTVRLWVNMFVSELLYTVFLGLTMGLLLFAGKWNPIGYGVILVPVVSPLAFPLVFIALHVFVAFLQAFVFTLLPVIYLGGAVAEEH